MGCTACLRRSFRLSEAALVMCWSGAHPVCPSCKSEDVQVSEKPLWFVHITVAAFKPSRASRTSIDIACACPAPSWVTMAPVKSGNSWRNLLLLTSSTERLLDEEDIDFGSDVYALAESSWNPIFNSETKNASCDFCWPQWALAWTEASWKRTVTKVFQHLKSAWSIKALTIQRTVWLFERTPKNSFWHRFCLELVEVPPMSSWIHGKSSLPWRMRATKDDVWKTQPGACMRCRNWEKRQASRQLHKLHKENVLSISWLQFLINLKILNLLNILWQRLWERPWEMMAFNECNQGTVQC